jgi:hypothetical protein
MKNMASLSFGLAAAVAIAGCFGSDPNQNSRLANPEGGAATGAGGGGSMTATGPIVGMPLSTFDTSIAGVEMETYLDMNQTNIANSTWINDGHEAPTMTFNDSEGSPSPGALELVAPFTDKNQHVDIQVVMGAANIKNWTGGKLHVRIKVTEGSLATGAGAQVFIKTTGTYIYGATYVNFPAGTGWKEFVVNLDAPMYKDTGYNPAQAISYGVQINTGGSATASQGTVKFHIDSFSIEGVTGGAGGAGGGAGGRGGASGGAAGAAGGAAGSTGAGGTGTDASAG